MTGTIGTGSGAGNVTPETTATGPPGTAVGFYILDARTGDRVGGEVKDPTVIPNGEMKTFRVSFSGLGIKDIGLVILVIGHDNYGAFTRK